MIFMLLFSSKVCEIHFSHGFISFIFFILFILFISFILFILFISKISQISWIIRWNFEKLAIWFLLNYKMFSLNIWPLSYNIEFFKNFLSITKVCFFSIYFQFYDSLIFKFAGTIFYLFYFPLLYFSHKAFNTLYYTISQTPITWA